MALSPRLELRQGQSLVMTPQLQQAIKLLQFSALELAAFVDAELERNPLLERVEPEGEPPEEARGDAEDAPELDCSVEDLHPDLAGADLADAGAAPLTDWSKAGSGKAHEDLPDAIDGPSTEPITLAEHLEAQMTAAGFSPIERVIGVALIDRVDEWGYARFDEADLASELGIPRERLLGVLTRMQGFEPTGVMARSPAECLTLQLKERNRFDPAMAALVERLDLLARNDLRGLQAACGVDADDLADMIAEIRALTPKPGAAFGGAPTQTVIPDIYVARAADGSWLVELNSDALPKVLVNQRYAASVGRTAREADKAFLSECAANANWLVKSLDQRARTILKVSREIVRQQDGFLAHGVAHLRPLNLKAVADAIGMHESTVSRVTSNKFMATPRGVFELKYFFTAAIASADGGEAHSAEAVRHRIKSLIEQERPEDVLSDDRIVEILREAGVDIARRTVAKYRESLRIPSSLERKRRLAR